MSVSPTDWQCCMPTESGLRCTKPLIYGRHDGPCVHEHDLNLCEDETMCGCVKHYGGGMMTNEERLGRLAGIREAIAIVGSIGFGCESCIAEALARLSALLPPPSGGEKAECTCAPFPIASALLIMRGCPFHAPKPDAKKP